MGKFDRSSRTDGIRAKAKEVAWKNFFFFFFGEGGKG